MPLLPFPVHHKMARNLVPYLKKLVRNADDLTAQDIAEALDIILTSDEVPDVQISGFLVGARAVSRDHQEDFILAAVRRLKKSANMIPTAEITSQDGFVDIVGTGGDGQNTFNVSTTAAIVASGMGIPVCKHGGPASTSMSGASDLLGALGAKLENVNAATAAGILSTNKFVYLSGPIFHPVLSRTKIIRKNMGVPSIFNLVGPLLNPAPIRSRIIGVYSQNLGEIFAECIRELNKETPFPNGNAMVVWGTEGLDEISPAQKTQYWKLSDGQITTGFIEPADFGLPTHSLSEVASGTPQQNAEMVRDLVDNKLPDNHPILDYVLLNSAALAVVDGVASDWKHGVELARESIRSGAAKKALDAFIAASQ